MNKKAIFNNKLFQQEFDRNGFVKIKFFSTEDMQPLLACFDKYAYAHLIKNGGFHHTTHHTKNWDLIAEVSTKLIGLLRARLDEIFTNYAVLGGNFILKDYGINTEFVPHQDWTLMDETKYHSANLWLPLHDLMGNNGMLRFLPGSMHLVRNLRMAPHYPDLFGKIMPLVYPHMQTVPLQLGEAVVFDCCLLHGSFANTSDTYRKNIIIGIYSADAEFKFYYNTQQGNPPLIEEYHINPDEFLTFAVGDRPVGRKPDRIFPYEFPVFTQAQFLEQYPPIQINATSLLSE
jgi:hypothetical protein